MKAKLEVGLVFGFGFEFAGIAILLSVLDTGLNNANAIFCLILGLFFCIIGILGIGFMLMSIFNYIKLEKNGRKYTGKIYGYVEDRSAYVNGSFKINIKVHYFDENNVEREVIVPTGFTRGSGDFPIGATIDIKKLGYKTTWIKNSVRNEAIEREEELMDDKPINTASIKMVAITCPGCGATFTTAEGYIGKCPYCDRKINS